MSEMIEELPGVLEKNLAGLLMPNEEVLVKLKGAFKEGLVCTSSRVLIVKAGFMTGSTFGSEAFQQPYRNIAGVQVKYGMMSGYLEVSAGGMQNTAKSYWSSDKNSDPAKASNCISLNNKKMRDRFQQAATFILQQVEAAQSPSAQPAAPVSNGHEAMLDTLAKLGLLRDQGILTEDEFAAKKAQILGL